MVTKTSPAALPPSAANTAGVESSLEIDGLHLSYGGFKALKEISLKVARGEFVALLGPSGCGKTSLLRAVAGFIRPEAGEIAFHDEDREPVEADLARAQGQRAEHCRIDEARVWTREPYEAVAPRQTQAALLAWLQGVAPCAARPPEGARTEVRSTEVA